MSEFFCEGPADSFAERDKIAVGAGTLMRADRSF